MSIQVTLEVTWEEVDKWAHAKGLTYMRRKNTLRDAGFKSLSEMCVYRAPGTERALALYEEIVG